MRVLLTHRPGGAYGFISEGWYNALRAAGIAVQRWDGHRESWDAFGPSLYIGCSGHRQPIPGDRVVGDRVVYDRVSGSDKKTRVAIHVNPYCPVNIDGINEPPNAIRWTVDQRPDAVFGYGHENDRKYWTSWTEHHQIPWVPMPTAGDSTIFSLRHNGTVPERNYDVGYVGGFWPYKAENINKYLIPVARDKSLNAVVHGWGYWPTDVNKGGLDDDGVVTLLQRSKVGPCIAEPHTTTWGIDLPERLWKVALCGALVVHDPVSGIERHMPSVIVARDARHYHELCRYYSRPENEAERSDIVERQRREVLDGNTYFHRLATLFRTIYGTTGDAEFLKASDTMLDCSNNYR